MTVQTNAVTVYYCEEDSPGVVNGDEVWKAVEPDDISTLGASISKISRNPISKDRMAKKGSISDLDSAVEYNADLTISAFDDFAQGYFMSVWKAQTEFTPTAVTTTGYTVASGGTLPADTLVYARNFSNSTNNGLHVTTLSTIDTEVEVTDTLVAESSPPEGATVTVAGVQGASGDITMDSDGNLLSTALDFTTLGLQVGQFIYIGGGTTDTSFATSGDGSARVRIITANKLTLDKHPSTFTTDAGTGKTIRIFIGSFIRNVPTDDADFIQKTYQFEIGFEGLDTIDQGWEYAKGNSANQLTISLATSDKATAAFTFVGLDTEEPVDTQKAGTRVDNHLTDAVSTTADIAKLSLIDSNESDLSTYFKSLELVINNNITPEKVIANLGAVNTNIGDLEVTFSTSLVFSNINILDAARNNETLSLEFLLKNDDGGLHFDIPSMTLNDSTKSFPRNESVLIDTGGTGHKDDFFGYVISTTKFPYLP